MKWFYEEFIKYPKLVYIGFVIAALYGYAVSFQGGLAFFNYCAVLTVIFILIDGIYKDLRDENDELKKRLKRLENLIEENNH
jgi:hypothetical protein